MKKRRVCSLLVLVMLAVWASQAATHRASALSDTEQTVKVEDEAVESHYPDNVGFTLRASGFTAQDGYITVFDPSGSVIAESERIEVSEAPSADVSLQYKLDIQDQYLPPDTELEYRWTLEDANGNAIDIPAQKLTLTDERFQWRTASDPTNNVTVHWHDGLDDFGEEMIAEVNSSILRMQSILGAKPDGRISIWIYSDRTEMFRVFPNGIIDWAGGFALPEWGLIFVDIAEGSFRTNGIRNLIPHEVAHLAVAAAAKNKDGGQAPTWLNEGLASYFEEARGGSTTVAEAVHDRKLIDMADLDNAFATANDFTEAQLAYDESLSIVDFMIKDKQYGANKIAKTLSELREGSSLEGAFLTGMEATPEEIEARWRESIGASESATDPSPTKTVKNDGGFLGLIPAMFCLGMPILIFLVWLPTYFRRRRMRNLES